MTIIEWLPYLILACATCQVLIATQRPWLMPLAVVGGLLYGLVAIEFARGTPAREAMMPNKPFAVYYCGQDTALASPLYRKEWTAFYSWQCPEGLRKLLENEGSVVVSAPENSDLVNDHGVEISSGKFVLTPLTRYQDK